MCDIARNRVGAVIGRRRRINQLYTSGEVTSQSLWSRYDRHFVGTTRYNALSYMAKIYRVMQTKLIQLLQENVHMITDFLPRKRISALSQWQTFLRVFTYRMAAKINCIDVEQNYVSVTLHVLQVLSFDNFDQGRSQGVSWNPPNPIPLKILRIKRVRTTHALRITLIELWVSWMSWELRSIDCCELVGYFCSIISCCDDVIYRTPPNLRQWLRQQIRMIILEFLPTRWRQKLTA